ncbi:caspase family protein [Prosthecomicrobium hirschii]|uniref:caspase family protein n=1 Tax=Prosthecodimorpha hirschii TaxID=665126 RepID=UPI002220A116|nr:caspase family protein [Prosthecomicrobium hirschii]MCW1840032.1 caspase family protein [Prosthecomicrobium hirschii]
MVPSVRNVILAALLTAPWGFAAAPAAAQAAQEDWMRCRGSDAVAAIEACTRIADTATLSPETRARALFNRAVAHGSRKDRDRQKADLDASIRLHPTASAYFGRGLWHRDVTRSAERQIADYDAALALDPQLVGALMNKATVLGDAGRTREAIALLDRAVATEPANAGAWNNRGNLNGRVDRAAGQRDWNRAGKLDANLADLYKQGMRTVVISAPAKFLDIPGDLQVAKAPDSPAPGPSRPETGAAAAPPPTTGNTAAPVAGTVVPRAGRRVALVIGNNDYAHIDRLERAVSDADAVARVLTAIGYDVRKGTNLDRSAINRLVAEFEASIGNADVALIYYAGHGVSIDNAGYILPVDMPKVSAGAAGLIRDEAVSIDALIQRARRAGGAKVVAIIDACRENPFTVEGARGGAPTRGLGRIESQSGTFVLMSAGYGQLALDRLSKTDRDPNSIFTRRLIPLLQKPGLTHLQIAKQLQREVRDLAQSVKHVQQPAFYDEIAEDVVLN